jgi:hypothetical protein
MGCEKYLKSACTQAAISREVHQARNRSNEDVEASQPGPSRKDDRK